MYIPQEFFSFIYNFRDNNYTKMFLYHVKIPPREFLFILRIWTVTTETRREDEREEAVSAV
jgi:hypothetical protein